MKYPAYPAYRPVHSPALKQLPAHWQLKRLRFATTGIEQGWSPQCDNEVADDDRWGVMKVGCVNGDRFDPLENKALPADLDPMPAYELQPGDVLVSRANTQELVGSAAVVPDGVRPRLLLCDKLFRIRPQGEVKARFLTYVLRTPAARYQYERDATGASGSMQNIGQDTIKNLSIPLPSTDEQTAITDFLDWRATQIDALIANKRALLDRMREEQDAVVTGAVTKGLAPNQPTKPSGVPWLGDVPRHWEVKRLKWAVTFQRGHDLPADDRNEGDVPLVSSSGISAVHDTAVAKAPGIVTGRYGTIGVFHLIEQDYWPLNTTLYSIDLHGNNPVFLCALLENLAPLFLLNAKKSAVPGVDRNDLHQIEVALPPREEQDRIADHLTKYEQKIKAVRTRVSDAIERLTEYRSALITAAVTGQIDVRGVPVPAPV